MTRPFLATHIRAEKMWRRDDTGAALCASRMAALLRDEATARNASAVYVAIDWAGSADEGAPWCAPPLPAPNPPARCSGRELARHARLVGRRR